MATVPCIMPNNSRDGFRGMQAIVGQSCRVTFTDDGQWLVTGDQQWFIFLLDSISGGFRGAQEIASFENGRFHVKQTFQSLPLGSMFQMWPQMAIRQICWTTKDALPPMTDTGSPALQESTSRLKPLRTPKQVELPPMTDTGFPALHESTSRLKPLRTPKQ
ncbi:unnamed protein product, partial [Symbiodinium sp. CCMP2592]